jgi:Xaa-Pro aminopeptidase
MSEFERKQELIQAFLDEQMLDALLLQRVSSFAWATCGAASYVNTATSMGEAMLLITRSGWHLLTNNIEATRLEQEERLAQQGWEFHVRPWHEARDMVEELAQGLKLGADAPYPGAIDVGGELSRWRANLSPEEGGRFRELSRLCAEAMAGAVRKVQPGQTEYQIAALLAQQAESRGVQAIVNLIATDERIFHFRHPLPTGKELERYAMLVLCGRRRGLICSLTRLVHFGRLTDELRRKADAVAQVDAAFIAATRPGQTLGQVFDQAMVAYKATGFADEWQLHHQGGPAGYEPREYIAKPGSTDLAVVGQAYAWNPSITGVKSEDTILVGDEAPEVMTAIEGWPMLSAVVSGKEYARPGVLEVL